MKNHTFHIYKTVHHCEARYDFLDLPVYWTIGHSIGKSVFLFEYELYDGYQGNIYGEIDVDIGRTDISKLFHGRQNDALVLCTYWTMPNRFCI